MTKDYGTFVCECCGKEGKKNNATQRYCNAECRKRVDKEKRRRYRQEREADKRAAAVMEERRERHATKPDARLRELSLEGKSLARVDAEARAFGLSYGQYTAAIRSGGIIQLLRSRGITNWREILQNIEIK